MISFRLFLLGFCPVSKGELRHQAAQLIDLMPTFAEVAEAEYPTQIKGKEIQPMEGRSLTPEEFDVARKPFRKQNRKKK